MHAVVIEKNILITIYTSNNQTLNKFTYRRSTKIIIAYVHRMKNKYYLNPSKLCQKGIRVRTNHKLQTLHKASHSNEKHPPSTTKDKDDLYFNL